MNEGLSMFTSLIFFFFFALRSSSTTSYGESFYYINLAALSIYVMHPKIYHTLPHSEFNVEYFIDFSLVWSCSFWLEIFFVFSSSLTIAVLYYRPSCEDLFLALWNLWVYSKIYVATFSFWSVLMKLYSMGGHETFSRLKSPGVQCGDGWGAVDIHRKTDFSIFSSPFDDLLCAQSTNSFPFQVYTWVHKHEFLLSPLIHWSTCTQ